MASPEDVFSTCVAYMYLLSWEYASSYYGKAREKRMGVPCGAQNNVAAQSQGPGVCLQHHVLHCCLRRKRSGRRETQAIVVFNFA